MGFYVDKNERNWNWREQPKKQSKQSRGKWGREEQGREEQEQEGSFSSGLWIWMGCALWSQLR